MPLTAHRSGVTPAASFAPACLQSQKSGPFGVTIPFYYRRLPDSEHMRPTECMRPTSLVWIQAGRHGKGDDTLDILNFLTTNDDAHRGSHTVPREYRASEESRREAGCLYKLGVFGSLAGEEVFRNGVMDAGLLDEHFASRGVQGYIDSFGGDPTRVTIAGVSALGRFVMLRDIAYGVILGTPSFVNVRIPTHRYHKLIFGSQYPLHHTCHRSTATKTG